MHIEIKSRYNGSVLFAGEFGSLKLCVEGAVKSRADLRGADLSRANLPGADLSRANLPGADLRGADLSGADLSRANLSGAYLPRADLRGADLSGADLSGANLSRADVAANLGTPDGCHAWTHATQGQQRIRVGCRDFTIAEARKYWAGKSDRSEVLAAVDYAEMIGKIRGWKQD